ncbi:MAG: glycerophosphodiester phosphodiesterase [Terriglobales bacterium]
MPEPTLCLGHRGHRCPAWPEPENSLAAFDRALACGCDGLELDLRHTADGRIVIHHDDALHFRGTAIEVGANRLGSLQRMQPHLASLAQVLSRYRNTAWLDLEIKTMEAARLLPPLLERYPPRRGFVVSCFDPEVLHHLAMAAPQAPCCLNLKRPCSLRRIRAAGVEWVAPHQASCTGWYVGWLRAHGWKVLVWTVNHPARMRLLAKAGADAICSDLPDLLVRTLARSSTTDARATHPPLAASFPEHEQPRGRHPAAGGELRRVVSKP